jgi:hypothetical protein
VEVEPGLMISSLYFFASKFIAVPLYHGMAIFYHARGFGSSKGWVNFDVDQALTKRE